MSRLIITEMEVSGKRCIICASEEERRIMELSLQPSHAKNFLNNIYVGQVDKVAENIQAAFVRFGEGQNGYLPLSEAKEAIFSAGHRQNGNLRPGDEILVQVRREAMKGKLPALTSNLNFTGKFLVLTTGEKKTGFSGKLSREEKSRLEKWLAEANTEAPDRGYGIIVRTNAAQASKEEFFREWQYLDHLYQKTAVQGRNRTCFSLLCEAEPFYLNAVRDAYMNELVEILTDLPQVYQMIREYLSVVSPAETEKLRLYDDRLLPLHKLYSLESAIEEIRHERVWMKSGGFLVIQQTEAFVSIDVNSGKYSGRKKAEETFRKINLEAAEEIARQLRLRNLSGIILIDFINMEQTEHQEELFHVLGKHLRRDPVKAGAVDITPLHIMELTRRKVRRPVLEELKELETGPRQT